MSGQLYFRVIVKYLKCIKNAVLKIIKNSGIYVCEMCNFMLITDELTELSEY
ncbi:hypothetical protein CPJCM30710_16940 [Clostridium polyendosporum]|uniref:Uncharacterized protein n=1 Tax=Clostridium polyendosporum TaxID=69208 RepID=A0A919VLX7_9CLOT|nr:hypothetical protein CPJCM30710_16940 [Clostridium polyendosporum]